VSSAVLVRAAGLGVVIGRRRVVEGIELTVSRREIVTLIGPNGAGKTTLVRAILGLLTPQFGSVERAPGLTIGYMPQRLQLPPNLPLTVRRFLTLTATTTATALAEIAEELAITQLLKVPMHGLSGGEHQRVLLARALLRAPQLLVLDEPVQGVDVTGQAELYALIGRIRDRYQCGVLMVSHDLHLVMASTDQVVCLNRHICCSGHPESIRHHPAYLELFGQPATARLALYTHQHDHAHTIHGDVVAQRSSGSALHD